MNWPLGESARTQSGADGRPRRAKPRGHRLDADGGAGALVVRPAVGFAVPAKQLVFTGVPAAVLQGDIAVDAFGEAPTNAIMCRSQAFAGGVGAAQ